MTKYTKQVEMDLDLGRLLRDEGMSSADRKEAFRSEVTAFVEMLPYGWEGLFESIRAEYTNKGGLQPEHHNAWGAMGNAMIRKGLLIKTGRMGQSQIPSSHARTQPVLRRT